MSSGLLPREKPSLWTSQTFSDPYQACSAAICSSVFTCLTKRTRTKMTQQHGIIATPCLNGTTSISSVTSATCRQTPSEKQIRSVIMQGKQKVNLESLTLPRSSTGSVYGRDRQKVLNEGEVKKIGFGVLWRRSIVILLAEMPKNNLMNANLVNRWWGREKHNRKRTKKKCQESNPNDEIIMSSICEVTIEHCNVASQGREFTAQHKTLWNGGRRRDELHVRQQRTPDLGWLSCSVRSLEEGHGVLFHWSLGVSVSSVKVKVTVKCG